MHGAILPEKNTDLRDAADDLWLCLSALHARKVTFSFISPHASPSGEELGTFPGR